jgi:hypothetical protein
MTTDLISQYRALHAQGKFLGLSVLKFADEIGELIKQYDVKTVLDYGSGQGHQYMPPHSLQKKWGVEVTCYDPAVEGLDYFNSAWSFGAVICSDVLEHIPEDQIDQKLALLFGFARKFVFLTTCPRPAKKTFPDGTNLHVTIKPKEWWEAKIKPHVERTGIVCVHRETP